MRRQDRQVSDAPGQKAILDGCKTLYLAMVDGNKPYVIPLSFGYEWQDTLTLYCHSAQEGRKIDVLRANPNVCFTMDCNARVIEGAQACNYSLGFASLIGEGTVRFIDALEEKRAALTALMHRQTGTDQAFTFSDESLARVAVLAIEVTALSGKQNKR